MPIIPDGQPLKMRYNTPNDTSTWVEVAANADGSFNMPSLVQMYDCIVFCNGLSRVGQVMQLASPSVELSSTGEAFEDGNTRYSYRVTMMPTEGQTWVLFVPDDETEYSVDWPS